MITFCVVAWRESLTGTIHSVIYWPQFIYYVPSLLFIGSYYMKGKSEWTNHSVIYWPQSIYCGLFEIITFVVPWRLTARQNNSCPVCLLHRDDWFFLVRVIDVSALTECTDLGWLSQAITKWIVFAFQPIKSSTSNYECLQWMENVDYLPIAKPVAINHLGIHCDCCQHDSSVWPVVGSSLWKPWFLLLLCNKENWAWKLWDRGTRWSSCGFSCARLFQTKTPTWAAINSSTSLMNSRPRKWPLVISSGRNALHKSSGQ